MPLVGQGQQEASDMLSNLILIHRNEGTEMQRSRGFAIKGCLLNFKVQLYSWWVMPGEDGQQCRKVLAHVCPQHSGDKSWQVFSVTQEPALVTSRENNWELPLNPPSAFPCLDCASASSFIPGPVYVPSLAARVTFLEH